MNTWKFDIWFLAGLLLPPFGLLFMQFFGWCVRMQPEPPIGRALFRLLTIGVYGVLLVFALLPWGMLILWIAYG